MRREYAPPSLPEYIYVVTKERVRAGRGPLKLRPIEYVYRHSEGYPICIKAAPARSSTEPRLIPLDICHASAQDAFIAVHEIAEKEAQPPEKAVAKGSELGTELSRVNYPP